MSKPLGFKTKAYRIATQQIDNQNLPAILYWSSNHFVILEKISSNYFTIVDPGSGRRKVIEKDFSSEFSGYILFLKPGDTFERYKGENVWLSFSYLVTGRPNIFVKILFLTLFLQLFTVGMPTLIQFVVDSVIVPQKANLLNIFLIGIIFLIGFHTLFTYLRGRILITLHNRLDYDLQTNFFKHILKLPYQFFLLRSFGDLLFRSSSMRVIRDQLTKKLVSGVLDTAILGVIFLYMFFQSPFMALIVSVIGVTNILIIAISRRYLAETNQKEVMGHAEVQAIQTEMLYGIFGVKTAGVENMMYSRWINRFKSLLSSYRKKELVLNYVETASSSLQIVAPLIILWLGAHQVFSGNITIGVLVAFHAIANQFFTMSGNIVEAINSFILTTSYLRRVKDVHDAPLEQNQNKKQIELEGDIKLENVSFSYSKYSPEVINGVSLHIKKGQKVSFVGKSGAGKTTLANIMLGLFQVNSGKVLYDNTPIEQLDLQHLRQQIGSVPQDVTLFNRSIYENITLHNPEVSKEQVIEVAKIAQIHDEIAHMPMKYNTMISEMGMNISGGQRQRIALAKALIDKPSILVLDEATSSLDYLNEGKIDDYLSSINCTRVVIAHRLNTVMNSDLIVVVEDGKIVDSGTHNHLLSNSSYYRRYYGEMIS